MQNIFTNIICSEIILSNANEKWYIILCDLFSRLCYIATCGPFCKDATHIRWFTIVKAASSVECLDEKQTLSHLKRCFQQNGSIIDEI